MYIKVTSGTQSFSNRQDTSIKICLAFFLSWAWNEKDGWYYSSINVPTYCFFHGLWDVWVFFLSFKEEQVMFFSEGTMMSALRVIWIQLVSSHLFKCKKVPYCMLRILSNKWLFSWLIISCHLSSRNTCRGQRTARRIFITYGGNNTSVYNRW